MFYRVPGALFIMRNWSLITGRGGGLQNGRGGGSFTAAKRGEGGKGFNHPKRETQKVLG